MYLQIKNLQFNNTLFQQSFERIIEFSRSQLINIHEKIGTREKSPDNRGPDNRGSTV